MLATSRTKQQLSSSTGDQNRNQKRTVLKNYFQCWKCLVLERYYDKRLVQRKFRTIQSAVELKKQQEWKNHIRATVHINYNLYSKAWNGWVLYVRKQRIKKQKQDLATDHGIVS
jgi:hypothetical protein